MKKLNHAGFSAVEAVLIVVIIGMLGFTGWFVWHSKQATDKTLSSAEKSSTSKLNGVKQSNSNVSKPELFVFKELGIAYTPPATLQKLTYEDKKISDGNGGGIGCGLP